VHAAEIGHQQDVFVGKLAEEIFGLDFERAQAAAHTEAQHSVQAASHCRSALEFAHVGIPSMILDG